ncbi:MAG TPA: Tad domain-containing protein [Bryobacteraceae bacterium]|nr:Tad domain-containing protein [Bryobacteraceae bacterium]
MRKYANRERQSGQAIVYAVCWISVVVGILALALDAGWAFYAARRAQTAVDSAALAAVAKALEGVGAGEPQCGGNVQCQSPSSTCPSGGNLELACKFAARNGTTHGGDFGRQALNVSAGVSESAPGVAGVPVSYWVTVDSRHSMPQWFSGLFTTQGITARATATAAIREAKAGAALYLLNRENDCFVNALNLGVICGEDLLMLGGNSITTETPIHLASPNPSGIGLPKIAAATIVGLASVNAPKTYIRGNGAIQALGGYAWNSEPQNGIPDGEYFTDPMAGKGQPPVPTGLPARPVPGGIIIGSLLGGPPKVLPPGHYYATTPSLPLLPSVATGAPVIITGSVVFSDGAPNPCGGFCEYVFHGGLVTAALSSVKVAPGRYVIAGAQPVAGGPGAGLSVGANSSLTDMTPLQGNQIGPPTDAGEIFIFTDSRFSGIQLPLDLASAGITLPQARAGVVSLGLGSEVILHGLNESSPYLPETLKKFAPTLIWQDQANTSVRYTGNGLVDLSCGGACQQILAVPGSQELIIGASSRLGQIATHLYGTVYGPRRSWLTIVGLLPGDGVEGPFQVITGAMQMTLNTRLQMRKLPAPPKMQAASLIQ